MGGGEKGKEAEGWWEKVEEEEERTGARRRGGSDWLAGSAAGGRKKRRGPPGHARDWLGGNRLGEQAGASLRRKADCQMFYISSEALTTTLVSLKSLVSQSLSNISQILSSLTSTLKRSKLRLRRRIYLGPKWAKVRTVCHHRLQDPQPFAASV